VSTSSGSIDARSGGYFVQHDPDEECQRIAIQDALLTEGMGGALPEQPAGTVFPSVLDVGCGTGGWLLELARTHPSSQRLVGVDINPRMVRYAQAQAAAHQVGDRVEFRAMDALRPLEFADDAFALVNHRFAQGYLPAADWPRLLAEYRRVSRPGGIIRVTESDLLLDTPSAALAALMRLMFEAFLAAGYLFSSRSKGITGDLERLLTTAGLQDVHTRTSGVRIRAGTAAGENYHDNIRLVFRTAIPFLTKWTTVPDNYEEIYQQALREVRAPDFACTWHLLTAWGTDPG
jgi:ubiquinone/menaquinone biosynthesis C-methylase UbiE